MVIDHQGELVTSLSAINERAGPAEPIELCVDIEVNGTMLAFTEGNGFRLWRQDLRLLSVWNGFPAERRSMSESGVQPESATVASFSGG